MTAKKRSGLFDSQRVLYLPADLIVPNPNQPRTMFVREGLEELADSIAEHGILQPLSVRQVRGRYQLISGERRLRAARMVGLATVPCILVEADDTESALLALVEKHCWQGSIRDLTTLRRDLWARRGEDSLTGLFLREMALRLSDCGEEDRPCLEQAVRFGMAALEGRDDQ